MILQGEHTGRRRIVAPRPNMKAVFTGKKPQSSMKATDQNHRQRFIRGTHTNTPGTITTNPQFIFETSPFCVLQSA
jgi:hypothetical protein